MRVRPASFLGATVLLLAADAAAFSVTYEQRVTSQGRAAMSRVKLKDDQFRIETVAAGVPMVIIRNAAGLYGYLPGRGAAMQLSTLGRGQQPVERAADYLGYLAEQNAEHLRAETISGYSCDVYRFTNPEGEGQTTAWVWREHQFPIRWEQDGPAGQVLVELSLVNIGADIPDSAFELPAGVVVTDMGAGPALRQLFGSLGAIPKGEGE
jgi:outer membrane lipoprotein-sorting protein